MEEGLLLKIALSFSLIGLIALFVLSGMLPHKEVIAGNLSGVNEGDDVKVVGVITDVSDDGKIARFKISQPAEIDAVLFKSSDASLPEGSEVVLYGEISEYNGKKQITASRIEFLE